jgi:hypothetical protein
MTQEETLIETVETVEPDLVMDPAPVITVQAPVLEEIDEILVVADEPVPPVPAKTVKELMPELDLGRKLPVEVEVTFSELLTTAIAQFSTDVSALTSLDAGVSQSTVDRAAAEAAMVSAVASQGSKISERDSGQSIAIASRDSLVSVLQSWTP